MSTLIISHDGSQFRRRFSDRGIGDELPSTVGDEDSSRSALEALADWAARYRRAEAAGAEYRILAIGEEMFRWLGSGGALDTWLAGPVRELEIVVDPTRRSAEAEALLAAPWEVLAQEKGFLAAQVKPFDVRRRCGGDGTAEAPKYSDLSMMFMASAPEGQVELDYEAEETAILEATKAKDGRAALAHVQVEESGALEFLAERVRLDGPFDALHLSCHGDIVAKEGKAPSPVLAFEAATGEADPVAPNRLVTTLGDRLPPLVFISACRTAERGVGRKEVVQAGIPVHERVPKEHGGGGIKVGFEGQTTVPH